MSTKRQMLNVARLLMALGVSCFLGAALLWLTGLHKDANSPSISRLESITERGYLKCGVNRGRYGYSQQRSNALSDKTHLSESDMELVLYRNSVGLEADMCRSIAIGLFGEVAGRLYFYNVDVSWSEIMPKVADGTIDVIFNGVAQSWQLENSKIVEATPVYYYDPVVIMTRLEHSNIRTDALTNKKICSVKNSVSELMMADFSREFDLGWMRPEQFSTIPEAFLSTRQAFDAFKSNHCAAFGGRYSYLNSLLENSTLQSEYHLLGLRKMDVVPIVGAIAANEPEWKEIVSQSIWIPMKAQARNVSAENVWNSFHSRNWSYTGLDSSHPAKIIRELGNYRDILKRNLSEHPVEIGANNHVLSHPDGRLQTPF